MNYPKKLGSTLFHLIFISILFLSCQIHETENRESNYVASIFIEPGPNDGGVDLLSGGGSLTLTLKEYNEFISKLVIPVGVFSSYPTGETIYTGTYKMSDTRIEFEASTYFLESIKIEKSGELLVNEDVPPRGRPFQLVLNRK